MRLQRIGSASKRSVSGRKRIVHSHRRRLMAFRLLVFQVFLGCRVVRQFMRQKVLMNSCAASMRQRELASAFRLACWIRMAGISSIPILVGTKVVGCRPAKCKGALKSMGCLVKRKLVLLVR